MNIKKKYVKIYITLLQWNLHLFIIYYLKNEIKNNSYKENSSSHKMSQAALKTIIETIKSLIYSDDKTQEGKIMSLLAL